MVVGARCSPPGVIPEIIRASMALSSRRTKFFRSCVNGSQPRPSVSPEPLLRCARISGKDLLVVPLMRPCRAAGLRPGRVRRVGYSSSPIRNAGVKYSCTWVMAASCIQVMRKMLSTGSVGAQARGPAAAPAATA